MSAAESQVLTDRVLVVDDDPELADALRDLLAKRLGLTRIHVVNDGSAAIVELQRCAERGVYFDLIVCDWQMPRCSGLQVLQWIRSRVGLSKTPFIFLTAVNEKELVLQAIESGATDYAMKPVAEDVILKKVTAVLARKK